MKDYVSVATGNILERRPNMFVWRDRRFYGLIDGNSLYDDPEDSFAAHVGIESSLAKGLIRPSNSSTRDGQ